MVDKKSYGARAAGFATLVILTLVSSPTFATGETKHPEFEADTKVEIIGEPRLGEQFEVVFTFSPQVDCYHTKGIPDTAYLRSAKGVKFLTGDTVWTGFLQKGNQYSLRAQYVVDSGMLFRFGGRIAAMEVLESIPQPFINWNGKTKVGWKCVTGARSRLIDLRSEEQKHSRLKVPVIMATDSGVVPTGSTIVAPAKEIMIVNPDFQLAPDSIPIDKGKARTLEKALQQTHRKGELPIKLDSSVPDTIRITYESGRVYVFVTDSSVTSVDLKLLYGNGVYEKIDSKRGKFQLESDSATFQIRTDRFDKILVIKSAQFYFIDGQSSYKHVDGADYPVRRSRTAQQ